jgi:3-deoxy-D-manno-octulosonic acid kinase
MIPAGFERRSAGDAELVLRADAAGALAAAGAADPESMRARALATYRGRGRPFGVDVPGLGRVFVRPYLHGGMLGRVTRDRFASDARFEAELAAHAAAAAAGVPVCEALGVVSRPAGLGMRRGWILLREVPGGRDLLETLAAGTPPARRQTLLFSAGRAMRALHDAGFHHPDLHLKNLLVTPADAVLVLDLDRAQRVPAVRRERRIADLFRFDRYAAKQAAAGHAVTRTDRLRVLRAYAGGDWPARAEVRELAQRLRRHIARHGAAFSRAAEVGARA